MIMIQSWENKEIWGITDHINSILYIIVRIVTKQSNWRLMIFFLF